MTETQKPIAALDHDTRKSGLDEFEALPDYALIRVDTVAKVYGVSIVTVWRWTKNKVIPASIKRGGTTGWNVGDIRRHIANRGEA